MSWKHRKKYPKNWEELSRACRERANWQCEECGFAHGAFQVDARGFLYQVSLAAAHLDRDPWNPNPRLKALCPDCHFKFDALENGRDARRSRLRGMYESTVNAGQMILFQEGGIA